MSNGNLDDFFELQGLDDVDVGTPGPQQPNYTGNSQNGSKPTKQKKVRTKNNESLKWILILLGCLLVWGLVAYGISNGGRIFVKSGIEVDGDPMIRGRTISEITGGNFSVKNKSKKDVSANTSWTINDNPLTSGTNSVRLSADNVVWGDNKLVATNGEDVVTYYINLEKGLTGTDPLHDNLSMMIKYPEFCYLPYDKYTVVDRDTLDDIIRYNYDCVDYGNGKLKTKQTYGGIELNTIELHGQSLHMSKPLGVNSDYIGNLAIQVGGNWEDVVEAKISFPLKYETPSELVVVRYESGATTTLPSENVKYYNGKLVATVSQSGVYIVKQKAADGYDNLEIQYDIGIFEIEEGQIIEAVKGEKLIPLAEGKPMNMEFYTDLLVEIKDDISAKVPTSNVVYNTSTFTNNILHNKFTEVASGDPLKVVGIDTAGVGGETSGAVTETEGSGTVDPGLTGSTPTGSTSKPDKKEDKPLEVTDTLAGTPEVKADKGEVVSEKPKSPATTSKAPETKPVTPTDKPKAPETKPVTPESKPVTPETKPDTIKPEEPTNIKVVSNGGYFDCSKAGLEYTMVEVVNSNTSNTYSHNVLLIFDLTKASLAQTREIMGLVSKVGNYFIHNDINVVAVNAPANGLKSLVEQPGNVSIYEIETINDAKNLINQLNHSLYSGVTKQMDIDGTKTDVISIADSGFNIEQDGLHSGCTFNEEMQGSNSYGQSILCKLTYENKLTFDMIDTGNCTMTTASDITNQISTGLRLDPNRLGSGFKGSDITSLNNDVNTPDLKLDSTLNLLTLGQIDSLNYNFVGLDGLESDGTMNYAISVLADRLSKGEPILANINCSYGSETVLITAISIDKVKDNIYYIHFYDPLNPDKIQTCVLKYEMAQSAKGRVGFTGVFSYTNPNGVTFTSLDVIDTVKVYNGSERYSNNLIEVDVKK